MIIWWIENQSLLKKLPNSVSSPFFADDCLIYRLIHSQRDHQALQEDLYTVLESWASDWGMRFNASKCYILPINKKPIYPTYFYQLNETFLKSVDNNPYLGLLISKGLKWSNHIDKITKKASLMLGFLRRNLKQCPKDCRKTAHIALVRSSVK